MIIQKIVSGKLDNNTYVVSNDKNECIIIDASCSLDEIKQLVGDKQVLAVLLTHGHYDHFMNLDCILTEYPQVKCFIYKTELEKLYSPKLNYSIVFNEFFTTKLDESRFEKIKDGEEFVIGNFNIKVILTKGHTDGSVCYLINNAYIFTGDTLFLGTHGRTDLLTGSYSQIQKSLKLISKKFKGLPFYAGHGDDGVIE